VKTVWEDGAESPRAAEVTFHLAALAPAELRLTELRPGRFTGQWSGYEIEELLAPAPVAVAGKPYAHGLTAFTGSDVEFNLHGLYDTFTAMAGMDDSGANGAAEFFVLADGKELWRSGSLKKGDAPVAVSVSISGAQTLTLRTSRSEAGRAQSDWIEPKISRAAR
jgi:hypothetical protein